MPAGAHTLTVALHPGDADGIDSGPVLALDPDAWIACRTRGLDTLGPGDLGGYRREQTACASTLLAAFRTCAEGDAETLHPLRAVFYRHVRWTHRVASVAAAVSCAVRERGVREVRTLGPAGGHAMDRPATQTQMPVLSGAAAAGARHGGASHECVMFGELRDELGSATPTPSGTMVGSLDEHVLVIADGPDLKRLLPMREQIEDAARAPVVFVSHDPSPRPPTLSVQAYAGSVSGEGHEEPGARRVFFDRCARAGGLAHAIVTQPQFASHLDFVFGAYARSVSKNIARWERALRARAPKAVIGSYHSVGLDIAAHLGIPALLLPHGPMLLGADEYTRSTARGVVAGAVGASHAERMRRLLSADHPVVETGVLGASDPAEIIPRTGARPRLLIPTSETARPALLGEPPTSLFDREAATIRRLVSGLSDRGWSITIRNHPRYDRGRAFYREVTRGAPEGSVTLTSAAEFSIEHALNATDAVAFTSAPSSAMLECARTGVPMLLITESWGSGALEQWGLAGLPHEPTAERAIDRLAPLAERGDAREVSRRALDARSAGAALLADRAADRTMEAIRSLIQG